MTRAADVLKAHWAAVEAALESSLAVEGATVWDELNAARESALLHAKALDETRRDLARAQREIAHLRAANRQLQHTLEAIRRLL